MKLTEVFDESIKGVYLAALFCILLLEVVQQLGILFIRNSYVSPATRRFVLPSMSYAIM